MHFNLFTLLFIFILGLSIGSFINCLVYRLHKEKSLWSRSFCPKCKYQLKWYENIPVLSWIVLKAKCRSCQGNISIQYPIVEFVTGILFVTAFIIQFPIPNDGTLVSNFQFQIFPELYDMFILLRNWFIISVMIVIFLYDLKYYLILDIITLPSIVIMFFVNLSLGFEWKNLVISGIIGLSFFLIQFVISRGKWIGGGDLRLGLLMGVILGWPLILVAILLSYIIGSLVGIPLLLTGKKKMSSKVPLGVFLTTGTIVTLFWGEKILNWYLSLTGI